MSGQNERDLRIAAYLDGAMSEEEALQFEHELEADSELADVVARFASNDDLLRQAMATDEGHGIDDAFLARMGLAEAAAASPPANNRHASPEPANDNPPFWKRWQVGAGAAIAACLALVLTFALPGAGPPGFGDALEATPSGQLASLGDGETLSPILTFEAGDGRFCREFTYATAQSESSGIACRSTSGWKIEAWSDDAVDIPDSSEIALAGSDGPSSLDEAYDRLDAGDPLAVEKESQIMRNGWAPE
ncbi:hypothetical protein FGU71_02940 [Erythrobacter insulae]|uniref:Zinc-finger domain-containing protein n=1 Tax=Erythrobacter insulae TaxID=2584124 RepID=A0A547P9W6_9SPHN|nr:hypothetical protein [Erythrobacter insulae]TRD10916.1 hypothetical protein FGU71_02940 [Erythrobacter insulae]